MLIELALYERSRYRCDMTTNEFITAQERIGCTGSQLARWLEVSPLTITRYRTGKVAVPGAVALAMKALAAGWRP